MTTTRSRLALALGLSAMLSAGSVVSATAGEAGPGPRRSTPSRSRAPAASSTHRPTMAVPSSHPTVSGCTRRPTGRAATAASTSGWRAGPPRMAPSGRRSTSAQSSTAPPTTSVRRRSPAAASSSSAAARSPAPAAVRTSTSHGATRSMAGRRRSTWVARSMARSARRVRPTSRPTARPTCTSPADPTSTSPSGRPTAPSGSGRRSPS